MTLMKALFPISLNNQRFSTKTVVPLLSTIVDSYDSIFFVIADKLQLYNKSFVVFQKWAMSGSTGANPSLFSSEKRLVGTRDERHKWIERVQIALGERALKSQFKVYAVDEIADRECFDVLRRVRTLFELDDSLKRDIERAADEFVARLSPKANSALQAHARGMSINYIVEEIALSIRLRVSNRIMDEYYIGQTIEPIWKLYNNLYMSSVWELAGYPHGEGEFKFFEVNDAHFQEVKLGPFP